MFYAASVSSPGGGRGRSYAAIAREGAPGIRLLRLEFGCLEPRLDDFDLPFGVSINRNAMASGFPQAYP
jgi:hypothetical protein